MSTRKYRCSDVDMLVVSNVVLENFTQHKDQLVAKRKTWKDPFADQLKNKIGNALDILGINTKTEQTATTRQLVTRQTQALDHLTTFKIQAEVDFEDDPDTMTLIEDGLGFSKQYSSAKSGSQEALIELLTNFKTNMTPELRKKIEAAGTDGAIIDELIGMRDEINDMNIKQETLKGSTPKKTALNIEEMNEIYKQVIGICKIAPRLLPDVPTAAEDFSFSRILNRLS
jgi:hypothetical protein